MSVTASNGESESRLNLHRSDEAKEPFWSSIWTNPEICNNCFARIKEVDAVEVDYGAVGTRTRELHDRTPRGIMAEAADDKNEYGTVADHSFRASCGACGSVRGLVFYDILSKDDALDLIEPLAKRLEEEGHAVDRDRMYQGIRYLKSQPEYRGFDREVFAVVAALGTRQ